MWGLAFLIGLLAFGLSLIKSELYEARGKHDNRAMLGGITLMLVALVGYAYDTLSATI